MHERKIWCLGFSPDGSTLVTVGGDNFHTVKVVDWRRQVVLAEGRGHNNDVLACLAPDVTVHAAAPPSPFSRCINSDSERASAK